MEKKKKKFDCMEMKRKRAEKLHMVISGMTLDEELSFWKQGTDELRVRQDEIRKSRRVVQRVLDDGGPEHQAIQFP